MKTIKTSKQNSLNTEKKKNPEPHLLYVKWAVVHLAIIEECMRKLDFGNINLLDILEAMGNEKDKLIKDSPAYTDAYEILESLRDIKFYTK